MMHIEAITLGLGGLVNAFFNGLTSWLTAGAASLLGELGKVMSATTEPTFNNGFSIELAVVAKIGAELTAPFLCIAVISAIVHQDLSVLTKAVFVRLPLSLLFGGIAVEIVSLALVATNGLRNDLLDAAGPSIHSILTSVSYGLVNLAVTDPTLGAFAGAFLAGVTALVSLMLWLELALRSAAIAVAVLFLPIALAGVVWPATAHWAKRLGETIAALVLSKLVIAGVLGLAATTLGQDPGASGVVEGIAILLLAVLAPFSLLRLVPAFEAGAAAHFEGLAQRGLRAANVSGAASSIGDFVRGKQSEGNDSNDSAQSVRDAAIPMMAGSEVPPDVLEAHAAPVREHLANRQAELAASEENSEEAAGD